ncbi:hypothetical protein L917_01187, partial [Phytophthora nicotianae]
IRRISRKYARNGQFQYSDLKFFPPNATDLCQPADSFVISKIKDAWKAKWNEKKLEFIRDNRWQNKIRKDDSWSGKLQNPGKRFFLQLAADAVKAVNLQNDKKVQVLQFVNLAQSFVSCIFNANMDGSRTGDQEEVACPSFLKDDQTYMGVSTYTTNSVSKGKPYRLTVRFKKYYKSLFLGFVDLAIVNAFIVFNRARNAANNTKMTHIGFMNQLHLELSQITAFDWVELQGTRVQNATPTRHRGGGSSEHMPVQTDETRKGNTDGSRKRPLRACKVCSLLMEKVTGDDTSFQCSSCVLTTTLST